jgi:hypothetical protein
LSYGRPVEQQYLAAAAALVKWIQDRRFGAARSMAMLSDS